MDDFSLAEMHALEATELPSCAINLAETKRAVAHILSTFGRSLIFSGYTVHDIAHVNEILRTLNWLIPKETQAILTKAEWLMLVLSAYFHDMGLIVTENEFNLRDKSGFKVFCDERLFSGPGAADYKAKVESLPGDKQERFLYEEFVRANHGRRVRAWIEGKVDNSLGISAELVDEIGRLLSGLDRDFRKDLAVVCESHNLDDIDDLAKYNVSRAYGSSEEESANLHYCALILRTVDLIQITKQRVPSTLFKLISPSDPISQMEWSKQAAVKSVRAKVAMDREGIASATLQSDTVEVIASFEDDNGFFGLTAYLQYAKAQLAASYTLHQEARKKTPRDYRFPWRYLDDGAIEVEGFEKEPFGFEIDQEKVLDLLTGHTLYNDSSIVVRELIQNSIDAVRLQALKTETRPEDTGRIEVTWDSAKSELQVSDNGTGMTQAIIERHFLKVGSSRYQDTKFKETHPKFSPISRFGIGVLSCFMVADSVEIVTVSEDDDVGRRILLRSVHGKYLIRKLDKAKDPLVTKIGKHGTSIRLKFRASAKRLEVLETVRRWIMFPRCTVSVRIDSGEEIVVGYESPKAAIEAFLQGQTDKWTSSDNLRVEQRERPGLSLAYALAYSRHFKDWSFMGARAYERQERDQSRPPVATCVEGIAVEFQVPGFRGLDIIAVVNAFGPSAPKTNVARTALELTPELESLAETVYELLFEGASEEVRRLQKEEGYSLTWAVEQLPFMASPLFVYGATSLFPESRDAIVSKVPMFLLESEGRRTVESRSSLTNVGEFWTVESQLSRSVESFVKEAKAEVTAEELMKVSQGTSTSLPNGAVLTNLYRGGFIRNELDSHFEVQHFEGHVTERRLDMKWVPRTSLWVRKRSLALLLAPQRSRELRQIYDQLVERTSNKDEVLIPYGNITANGLDEYSSVQAYGKVFFLPGSTISTLFAVRRDKDSAVADVIRDLVYLNALVSLSGWEEGYLAGAVDRYFNQVRGYLPADWVPDADVLRKAMLDFPNRTYDPLSWGERRTENI